jgi:exopolyphosphatase / guanosine-5'-triphosphate,3'-diphosphate pyrophosphatase
MRRAVIDIGTNTVKLLVADVDAGQVRHLVGKDRTTRLGEGLDATGRLARPAIDRTVIAIRDFIADAQEHGAADILALATSAARDAGNRDEFLDAVRQHCRLDVQVISGQREAELIFRGVSSDPAWATERILVMDVGGGSAEFVLGLGRTIEHWQSLPLGAVRVTEQFTDFAGMAEYLRRTLRTPLADFHTDGWKLVATGGTNTTLARVAKGKSDHVRLTQDEVRAWVTKLNAMSLEERQAVPGLPSDRADIIVAGGAVILFAMETLGVFELTVSIRNLRYGALLD